MVQPGWVLAVAATVVHQLGRVVGLPRTALQSLMAAAICMIPTTLGPILIPSSPMLSVITSAFLTCRMGDWGASLLAAFSTSPPRRVTDLSTVQAGQPGGVTFHGVIGSLLAGAAAGWLAPPTTAPPHLGYVLHGAVLGCVGSGVDSLIGALAATLLPHAAAKVVADFCSSYLTAVIALALLHWPTALPAAWLAVGIWVLAFAPLSRFYARKLLHLSTSVLVLLFAQHRWIIVAVAVVTLTTLYTFPGLLARFESGGVVMPGIPTFTVAVGATALLQLPPITTLSPMMFSDPAAAVVGSTLPSPRLYGSKTLAGCVAFFITSVLCLTQLPELGTGPAEPVLTLTHVVIISAVLTAVELVSGSWDNLALPIIAAAGAKLLG